MRERAVLRSLLPPVIALALGLLLWEVGTRLFAVPEFLLPAPSVIARVFRSDGSALLRGALSTGRAAVLGFLLAAAAGVLIAIFLASSRLFERAFYPYAVFLQTVPIVAIAPLFVVWFGSGLLSVTLLAFVVSVFPVIVSTLTGLRSVDPALTDMFKLYGAGRFATLIKLTLPSALPSIFSGLRIASGLAVIGAIVCEGFAGFSEGTPGLGILVLASYKQLRTDLLFAAVLGAAALGLALFGTVNLIGARVLGRWHPSEKSDTIDVRNP